MSKSKKASVNSIKKTPKKGKASAPLELGVMNVRPAKFYSQHPCGVGFSYIRFEVSGQTRACCIANHSIGDLSVKSWRQIWRSAAYAAFRSKMLKIHKEKFHLKDPEYLFCQQCSHMSINLRFSKARSTKPK